MRNRSNTVDRFLEQLDHPMKDAVADLRVAILASNDQLVERIKWNAPSFGSPGEDRVTFKLYPKDRIQMVFHRGAGKQDTDGFAFDDASGLLVWAAPDRAIVTLRTMEEVRTRASSLVATVNAWIDATV